MWNNKNTKRSIENRLREALESKIKITIKPSMWSEEERNMLSERELEIRAVGENRIILSWNVMLMEESARYAKIKGFTKELFDQIDYVRLHEKVHLI